MRAASALKYIYTNNIVCADKVQTLKSVIKAKKAA
jgi:hypothetical protein